MGGRAINLLPSAQWNYSFVAFLLKWVVSYGRYVLVITELIVILAFLSRFKLDQDLLSLEDRIRDDRLILESSRKFEDRLQKLTSKQGFVIKEWKDQYLWSEYLKEVTRLLPQGVVLSSITASGSQLSLTGSSLNETALAYLMNNFKKSPAFKRVSLEKVASDLSSKEMRLITFSLTVQINPVYVKYRF
ncbi:MAG: PilN domain-containing protein [bacterium]|nr:PilN domain-containing protein [bacterium]